MGRTLRVALLMAVTCVVPSVSHAATITFGTTTTNLVDAATTFAFTFGIPVAPDFYVFASSIGTMTVTPGPSGEATVEIANAHPTYLSASGLNGLIPTNLGVDQGTAPCVATRGVAVTCQFPLLTSTFSPAFFDAMQGTVAYKATGSGAIVQWNGAFVLDTTAPPVSVPEPATGLLLGAALAAGMRVRRPRA